MVQVFGVLAHIFRTLLVVFDESIGQSSILLGEQYVREGGIIFESNDRQYVGD